MSKVDKKRMKLQEKIAFLEAEMFKALKQKTSTGKEISISDYMDRIATLKRQLASIA